jgi:hypothetical protein
MAFAIKVNNALFFVSALKIIPQLALAAETLAQTRRRIAQPAKKVTLNLTLESVRN